MVNPEEMAKWNNAPGMPPEEPDMTNSVPLANIDKAAAQNLVSFIGEPLFEPSPEKAVLRDEDLQLLRQGIAKALSKQEKDVVYRLLAHASDHESTPEEVASEFGMTIHHVNQVRLHIRQKLRKWFKYRNIRGGKGSLSEFES